MSFPRQIYEFFKAASIAHAKWDYEASMRIIKSRKRLLVLFILLLPIMAASL
ncbi:MAG: sulfite exporter TauE/SafE family protein, partial [Nitrospirae bacterium]|nr:sulfite exporter TauE/SafE family protein [Nitrospirota bacterium]